MRNTHHLAADGATGFMPLRFFVTAPLFAALSAALLAWPGDAARHAHATLAAAYLLALGCLAMPVTGALLWFLPVMAGIPVAGARVARAMHALLCAGTLSLAAALLDGHELLGAAALATLAAACLSFGWCTMGVWRHFPGSADASLTAIRLSLVALAGGAIWALPMAVGLTRPAAMHGAWTAAGPLGVFGWLGLAAVGMAIGIVPACLATPPYPRWVTRGFARTLFLLLAVAMLPPGVAGPLPRVAVASLGAGYGAFALVTLWLLARHRSAGHMSEARGSVAHPLRAT